MQHEVYIYMNRAFTSVCHFASINQCSSLKTSAWQWVWRHTRAIGYETSVDGLTPTYLDLHLPPQCIQRSYNLKWRSIVLRLSIRHTQSFSRSTTIHVIRIEQLVNIYMPIYGHNIMYTHNACRYYVYCKLQNSMISSPWQSKVHRYNHCQNFSDS